MPESTSTKKRIEYIDAMRGFTMILVVFSHVELFGFNIQPNQSFLNSFFMCFRMPLFFFISGYIANKTGKVWDWQAWKTGVYKKILIQLIPTITFGILYTISCNTSIIVFISDPAKLGYWFTISLLVMFIIYYSINYIFHRYNEYISIIVLCITTVILYKGTPIISQIQSLKPIFDLFCLSNAFYYFQFFVFGVLMARFKNGFDKVNNNKYLITAIIILFVVLLYTSKFYLLARYLGLIIVFCFFRKYEHSFTSKTQIGQRLQNIGRRTLDIYLLHYFFLPVLPMVGTFLLSATNITLELTCGIILSLIIIYICLIVSNIIRLSDLLGHYLFGAKESRP